VVDNVGDAFLVQTDRGAPNGRVVLIDPRSPDEKRWKTVLPERPEPLQGARTAGGKLFAEYLKDVASRVHVHALDGTLENDVALRASNGERVRWPEERYLRLLHVHVLQLPPTILQYDIATKRSTVFREARVPGFKADDYE